MTHKASWQFANDGAWQAAIETTSNGITTWTCLAKSKDTHWSAQGTRVVLRDGTSVNDYLFEISEGNQHLRLDYPVTLGAQNVNAYTRAGEGPITGCD